MIVRFAPRTSFTDDLKGKVEAFVATQDHRAIRRRMLTKTLVILAWTLTSYLLFLFWATEPWQIMLSAISMGLAAAGIGMAVMHDANHGAYPVGPFWTRAIGFTLDLLGGSSYIWKYQHNVNHHTFTNVVGADNDISIGKIARIAPSQAHRPYHRAQHVYMWPLYSLLALTWAFWADWRDLGAGAIGSNPFPRPRGNEALLYWVGKLIWATLWLVIPLVIHPLSMVVVFGLVSYLVTGFVLSVVFQLAHVVESVDFPVFAEEPARSENEFWAHQVATTANFAPNSAFLNWYLGGLNYQVEHHLFPKVCHLHYPKIAAIVEAECKAHGLPYHSFPRLSGAIRSHYEWLRTMGQPEPEAS